MLAWLAGAFGGGGCFCKRAREVVKIALHQFYICIVHICLNIYWMASESKLE